jgi:hypothetical protein
LGQVAGIERKTGGIWCFLAGNILCSSPLLQGPTFELYLHQSNPTLLTSLGTTLHACWYLVVPQNDKSVLIRLTGVFSAGSDNSFN